MFFTALSRAFWMKVQFAAAEWFDCHV